MFNPIEKMFIFVAVYSCHIKAASLDDLKQSYANMILECAAEYSLTADDFEQLKKRELPDKETVKCLFACAYKKTGMMNDQGELSVEGVNEISQKYLSDDPDKMKKSVEFTEACRSVNNEPVSDGTKGCDRAALIFKCSVEKIPEFGIAL